MFDVKTIVKLNCIWILQQASKFKNQENKPCFGTSTFLPIGIYEQKEMTAAHI